MTLKCSRAVAAVSAAAIALTSASFAPAMAAPVSKKESVAMAGDVDVSSRRKRYRSYNGNRAALGAVAGIFGTIAAIAAADAYRDRYYRPYGYYGHAPYYAPPPYYYGGGPYYPYGW
jgi:hypothetical protein